MSFRSEVQRVSVPSSLYSFVELCLAYSGLYTNYSIELSPGSGHHCFYPLDLPFPAALDNLPLPCDHLHIPRKPLIFCFADSLVLCRILYEWNCSVYALIFFFLCSGSFEIVVLNTLLLDMSTAICFVAFWEVHQLCVMLSLISHFLVGGPWSLPGWLSERKLIWMSECSTHHTGVSHLSGWPSSVSYSVLKSLGNYQTILKHGSHCTSLPQYLGLRSPLSLHCLLGSV